MNEKQNETMQLDELAEQAGGYFAMPSADDLAYTELLFDICKQFGIRYYTAAPKEKAFVEEVTRVTWARQQQARGDDRVADHVLQVGRGQRHGRIQHEPLSLPNSSTVRAESVAVIFCDRSPGASHRSLSGTGKIRNIRPPSNPYRMFAFSSNFRYSLSSFVRSAGAFA